MPCKLPTRFRVPWRPHHQPTTPFRWRHHTSPWPRIDLHHKQHRQFGLSSIPTVLLPPVVFTGLLITLWTYKCLMMIIFQNKIIYMPSMPPFSRSEKIEDYVNSCKPVVWTEHSLKSGDGTALKLLEGSILPKDMDDKPRQHTVIVYFQGNASSVPPRLPHLSNILKLLQTPTSNTQYTLLALSYRGFWKSKGSANQTGIELDAQAALEWVSDRYISEQGPHTKVVLWGQSIGAGVATTASATWLNQYDVSLEKRVQKMPVAGLLLETPFTSLNAMLIELYPQKLLPYRYLGPFLMSTWNSVDALSKIGKSLAETNQGLVTNGGDGEAGHSKLKVLLLEAENDELVPKEDAKTLHRLCAQHPDMETQHKVVTGALHTDVMTKNEGKREIVRFLKGFEDSK